MNYSNSKNSAPDHINESQIEASSDKSEFNIPTEGEKISELKINSNIVNVDEYEILDVENITFEQYISGYETVERALFPTVFDENNIYVLSEYYSQVDNKNKQNTISSFNILTEEYEELFSYDFNIGYAPDFIYKDHYFTFPCTYNEHGNLQINIIDYDKKKDISQTIYHETVTSPYYYADYLNENEVVFLIFPSTEKKLSQRVLKYNFATSTISVLYENEYNVPRDDNNTPENIWTIDTYNGSVFLLNTQVTNGNRSWNVSELSSSGEVLNKTVLTGLYDYRDINCSVNQFVVTPNEYLIQYYDPGDNSNFVAINRGDESINTKFDKDVPCTLISPFWIKDRYLLYSTFPDYGDFDADNYSTDISVYDSVENAFHFIKITIDSKYSVDKTISNDKGDVVLVVTDDTEIHQFLLVKDIISYVE